MATITVCASAPGEPTNEEAVTTTKSWLDYFKMRVATLDKICCFLAELIGTGLLVFLGCMGCVSGGPFTNSHLQMTLNFGLVVMLIIQCFGCVSGAHLNPAVTVAAYFYNLVSLSMVGVYFVAQMLGGFIGYGLLKVVLPAYLIKENETDIGMCVTVPHADITLMQGVTIEFIITTVLIFVCCGVWDPRNAKFHDSVPIRFGLTISCLAMTAGPFTGASMNPARSFAPALWNGHFNDHWIYWVGPMAASVIGTVAYKAVFRRELPTEKTSSKLRAMEEVPLS